jgi:hypothetical protein
MISTKSNTRKTKMYCVGVRVEEDPLALDCLKERQKKGDCDCEGDHVERSRQKG